MLDTLPALLWALGDPACGDVLESAVFNALPASRGLQRANQLLPGEGEPAAGWARYGASLWMAASDGGLAAIGYAPCQVRWRLCGQAVRLQVDTSYPAEERVRILVHTAQPAAFPIHLRIPAWAEGARWQVNGEEESAAAAGPLCARGARLAGGRRADAPAAHGRADGSALPSVAQRGARAPGLRAGGWKRKRRGTCAAGRARAWRRAGRTVCPWCMPAPPRRLRGSAAATCPPRRR